MTKNRSIFADRSGGLAIQFALIAPLLLLACGGAIDYARSVDERSRLQSAADKAALTAARELSLSDSKRENVPNVVEAVAMQTIEADGGEPAGATFETTIGYNPLEVTVVGRQRTKPVFGGALGLMAQSLEVRAVARIVGQPNICVLALEKNEPGAVWLVKNSELVGNGCSVFSNSTSSTGLAVRDGASMTADSVCSAGGIEQQGTISPAPYLDCPQFDDPLAARTEPAVGPCDYTNKVVDSQTITLTPGVYCGGLRIKGTADVTFEPGIYAIQNGLFTVLDSAKISGDGVSFLLGKLSFLMFGPDSTISLAASKTGPLAGILIFGSRSQSEILTHTILSRNAQQLVGTIYLPNNSFIVDGDAGVGGSSAYTAIVARRLVLLNGPRLVLNSNYDQTDVPVPSGIRGATQPATLIK